MFINDFYKEIEKYLGMENLETSKKEKLLNSLEELVKEITLNYILENLDDESCVIFTKLIDEDETGSKAFDFARSKIINLEIELSKKIKEEIEDLKT